MSDSKKTIIASIEGIKSIGNFVIANEEIAANNMRRIRDAVVKRRTFTKEITELYNEVKSNYQKEVKSILAKGKKQKGFEVLKTNNMTARVILSTNSNLFGDIVKNTYSLFKKDLQLSGEEIVIVGKTGKHIFEDDNPGIKFTYFDYPDDKLDADLLKQIVMHIIKFEKVIIYHSKFQTLVNQTPTAFVITESTVEDASATAQRRYFFEPSLPKVIEYFEKEIFGAIFEQTMHESHLSKFASRMVTLDSANENIKKQLKNLSMKRRFIQHQLTNKEQVNSMIRLIKWRRQ